MWENETFLGYKVDFLVTWGDRLPSMGLNESYDPSLVHGFNDI